MPKQYTKLSPDDLWSHGSKGDSKALEFLFNQLFDTI